MNYYYDNLGALFGDKHTFRDYGMYPSTRFNMLPPEVKDNYIEIPGSDGELDMTQALTGFVNYGNREFTQDYIVVGGRDNWSNVYSTLLNDIHGKKMRVVFDEDPYYFYVGRLKVDEWQSNRQSSIITIKGTFEPYKYEIASTTEDWLWNPFNFENGVIREYADIEVIGTVNLELYGTNRLVYPEINLKQGTATITEFNGETMSLELISGAHTYPDIALNNGVNTLTVYGGGAVISIDYRGVSL